MPSLYRFAPNTRPDSLLRTASPFVNLSLPRRSHHKASGGTASTPKGTAARSPLSLIHRGVTTFGARLGGQHTTDSQQTSPDTWHRRHIITSHRFHSFTSSCKASFLPGRPRCWEGGRPAGGEVVCEQSEVSVPGPPSKAPTQVQLSPCSAVTTADSVQQVMPGRVGGNKSLPSHHFLSCLCHSTLLPPLPKAVACPSSLSSSLSAGEHAAVPRFPAPP